MESIGGKAISGSIWLTIAKYAGYVLKFAGGIFLARMIAPQYFGQVGFSSSIILMIFALSGWGSATAILRQNKNIEEYIGTLLSIRVASILFLGAVTIILSYPVYLKYGASASIILITLTLSYLPSYISDIHRAYMEKELLFKRLAFVEFAVTVCSITAACFLAFKGYKVLALVAMIVLDNMLTGIFLFMLSPKPIRPCFNKESAVDFFHYGKYCFLNNNLNTVYDQAGDFCIGAFTGNRILGLYQRAYLFSYLCARVIWSGTQNVMGSIFGRLQKDKRRLEIAYEILNSTIFRISLLFSLWLGLTMPDLVNIVYGKEWLEIVPLFRMLIPFAVISGIREINLNLQLTAGHSLTVTKAQLFETGSFLILLIPLFLFFREKGVIIAVNSGAIVGIVLLLKYSSRLVGLQLKRMFFAPVISSVITLAIVVLSFQAFQMTNIFTRFIAQSSYIILVYFLTTFLIEGAYVKSIIYKILQQKNRGGRLL